MNKFHLLPLDSEYSKEELIQRYNNAVWTIWDYQQRYYDLSEDYELLLADYDTVTNQLYG